MTKLLLPVLLSLALAGCGVMGSRRGSDLPAPPSAAEHRADLGFASAWRAGVGPLRVDSGLDLRPAPVQGRVYTAATDGTVTAFDAGSGQRLWQVDLDREISAGPASDGRWVVVGTREGQVLGLDAEDGRTAWISGVTSEVQATPAAGAQLVVARTIDGRVFGLDPASGSRLWMYEQTPPLLTLRGSSSPLLIPGRLVVAGMSNGKLVGLAPEDGALRWETTVAPPRGQSDLERMVDVNADPVVLGGEIYAVSYQGRLVAVDAPTGRIRWQRDVASHIGLSADSDRVYLTDSERRIWSFDRATGASLWRQDELRGLRLTPPARFADFVVVGDNDGYLNWLSPQDGSLLRRERIGGAFVAAPVADGDSLYLLTEDGLTVLR